MIQVGHKVVCIKNYPDGIVKCGEVYEVIQIRKGLCKCTPVIIDIGKLHDHDEIVCVRCNKSIEDKSNIHWMCAGYFAPLDEMDVDSILDQILANSYENRL